MVLSGCDSAPQSSSDIIKDDPLLLALSKVGHMHNDYHDVHNKGPANWEELKTMAGGDQSKLDAIAYVQSKGYDLQWGVRLQDLTEGASRTVLARSPQESSLLYFDGSVQK